jgi:hypothetical protein
MDDHEPISTNCEVNARCVESARRAADDHATQDHAAYVLATGLIQRSVACHPLPPPGERRGWAKDATYMHAARPAGGHRGSGTTLELALSTHAKRRRGDRCNAADLATDDDWVAWLDTLGGERAAR